MAELVVGEYVLERKLKAGSAAEVHLGRHSKTQTPVAVKIFTSKAFIKDPEVCSLVAAEVDAAKVLKHPHIIKVLDVIEEGELVFIVMTLATGGDLLDLLNTRQNSPMSEEEVKDIFAQLISALQYTHAQGFAHRDIKLENILIEKGEILLSDWSLCTRWKPGQTFRDYVGSTSYMSPEVMDGRPYEGPELDIWSAGVVLFALFFNGLPFEATTVEGVKSKISGGLVFPQRRKISDPARDLLRKMLKPQLEDRIKLNDIVSHPFLRGHPRLSNHAAQAGVLSASSLYQRYTKVYSSMDQLWRQSAAYCSAKAGSAASQCTAIMNRTLGLVCVAPEKQTSSPCVSLDLSEDDSSSPTPMHTESASASTNV